MPQVDMDGSGMLNFPEFLAMMGYKVTGGCSLAGPHLITCQAEGENAEDEIREAFQVFDGVIYRSLQTADNCAEFRPNIVSNI